MSERAGIERHSTLKIVIVGHVDHGKSTLIGRLLHDTDSLPDGKVASIKAMSERRGMPFEFAFLLDALQAERDQGITIDTTQIWLRAPERDIVIIDAPGHKEFLRNMITGAAQADAAVLVIDAAEGVREQSRRHGYLLHLLGVQQVVVVVNKMDMVDYDRDRFQTVRAEIVEYLSKLGVTPADVVPLSARQGDNVARGSTNMPWYRGPTLLQTLQEMRATKPATELPLRLAVQDVYKFDQRRIIAGRIDTGRLFVGDTIVFSPFNNRARIASIESWPVPIVPVMEASAGQSVGITLDEQIFVERGALASHEQHLPIETDVFRARLFWLAAEPLLPHAPIDLKLGTAKIPAYIQSIERVIDATDLSARPAARVERNEIAEVTIRARRVIALDSYGSMPRTGRFVVTDAKGICAGGIVSMEGYADQRRALTRRGTNLQRVELRVTGELRSARNGHRGGVIWLTGLSGAGKSTLAIEAEKRLFDAGYQVCVLDGDNIRDGLNADLSFSPEDRAENIRRVGEVAALMARFGFIVVTAFISPYRADRERARAAAADAFREVFVAADLAECERRDPKGLYRKARAGQIRDFTGIDAPYEAPEKPEFVVETGQEDIESSARKLVDYVRREFALKR